MKKTLILCLALLFIGFAVTATRAQTKTDIFGYYELQGKIPAAFADISEIHLAGEYGAEQKPPVYGLIRLKKKSAKDFPLNEPVYDGKNISFTTKTVGGISYKFSGTFAQFPNNAPETVLRGVLQKFRGKTKIAEAKVKFSYEQGD